VHLEKPHPPNLTAVPKGREVRFFHPAAEERRRPSSDKQYTSSSASPPGVGGLPVAALVFAHSTDAGEANCQTRELLNPSTSSVWMLAAFYATMPVTSSDHRADPHSYFQHFVERAARRGERAAMALRTHHRVYDSRKTRVPSGPNCQNTLRENPKGSLTKTGI